jgi:SAM-dependent methyltransferase
MSDGKGKPHQDPKVFNEEHYQEWRRKRLDVVYKHLDKKSFHNKSVLEAGAGLGHIAAEIKDLGAHVVAAEARKETIALGKKLFPSVDFVQYDFDGEWKLGKFDIIFHFGLLYHLLDPRTNLEAALDNCDILILETVIDIRTVSFHYQDKMGVTEGYNWESGEAEILSCSVIEDIFAAKQFDFNRIIDQDLDMKSCFYSPKRMLKGSPRSRANRGLWVAKRVS